MSTIPTTFDQNQVERTVLAGKEEPEIVRTPLAVILLCRNGAALRSRNLQLLLSTGFRKIVSIEVGGFNYKLAELSRRYPSVTFIIPQQPVTVGDMINLGMNEVPDGDVLVLWDDMTFLPRSLSERALSSFMTKKILCTAPMMQDFQGQNIPVKMSPQIVNKALDVNARNVTQDQDSTLFPFDFTGIYDKSKFIRCGGFDYTIKSPYWQNLDFSLRAWLWGEEIRISHHLKLSYEENYSPVDSTPDESELCFYLKNIAPKFVQDYAYIPKKLFFRYWRQRGGSFADSLGAFKDAREWVEKNRYNFKTDFVHFISDWETL